MLAGDFNINLLHFEQNKMIQNFPNLMFQIGLVSATNKPTRVTKETISAEMLTANISEHFPIIYAFKSKMKLDIHKTLFLYKRFINENRIKTVKSRLHEISWEIIKGIKDPNKSYKKFIAILTSKYDEFFSKSRIKVRHDKNLTP